MDNCVARLTQKRFSQQGWPIDTWEEHHEWVLIEEKFKIDSVYWRATEKVLKRRWYCKFCRIVEEEKV